MRIIQVGAIPPPYGGVTIHLLRLLTQLRKGGADVELFDVSGIPKDVAGVTCMRWRRAVLKLLFRRRAIVHFHNFTPRNIYAYALLGMRHCTVLSLHNERFIDELNNIGRFERRLLLRLLNRLERIIVDSSPCEQLVRQIIADHAKIAVIPEYISAPTANLDSPPSSLKQLRTRAKYLIATNAHQLVLHNDVDMYGIDLLIELTDFLVHQRNFDVITVLLLPNPNSGDHYQELRDRVRQLDLEQHFLFFTEPIEEAVAVWRLADVVIRATNTDGNSLTVLEALACGVPVIASDCSPRHPATVLFKTRDLDDLKAKTLDVLEHLEQHRLELQGCMFADNVTPLQQVYHQLNISAGSSSNQ